MEAAITLVVLLALVFPILAIVSIVIAAGARADLRKLELRIAALEPGAARAPAAAAVPPAAAVDETPPPAEEPAASLAPLEPPPAASDPEPEISTATAATSTPDDVPTLPTSATRFEERFGTQWVVWIGGLALALGGIFLVRYSIEQGWIGPGVRIFLAAVFSALLVLAGEWARRNEIAAGIVAIPGRHIPSILTAAGTVAGYATVYAAYALYGFLAPAAAFVLLGIVALATLAAALLHGPALAGLGVVGAFVAPALVHTAEPNYWALYIYLTIVSAAAFALARARLWHWLAVTALVLAVLWLLPGVQFPWVQALAAHLFYAVAGFGLAAGLIVSGLLFGPAAERGKIETLSSGAIAAYVGAAGFLVVASHHDTAALTVLCLLGAATVAIAWRTDAALGAVPIAAAAIFIVLLLWAAPNYVDPLLMPSGVTHGAIPEPPTGTAPHVTLAVLVAALFGLSGYAALGRTTAALTAMIWSATAVVTPIAILIALYIRIAEFDPSIPFAAIALLLAALNGSATDQLIRREPRPGLAAAAAFFACGAIAALALALTFALEKGWLTVSLALMVPGIAWVSDKRPLPVLRQLTSAIIALVLMRVAYEPRIVGNAVGTTPIFNWLLYGYGVPAASFWYAGYLLRRRADDGATRRAEAAAILFTVLFAVLQIRHFMNNGDVFRESTALAEIALQVCVGLALTIGLERLRLRTGSIVHDIGAELIAALTFGAIVLGLVINANPYLTGRAVGGAVFNLVLLGYGIPAVLAGMLALATRNTRPLGYRFTATATAVGLAILYLSLEVRTLYHGPLLVGGGTSDAEQYTYSAIWLVFGVLLLLAGFLLRSQPARLTSAAVVALTIAKVFLVDMAGLTGIFRALSFICLGIVLVSIGWLYQRVSFPAPGQAIGPLGPTAESANG